MQNFYKLESNYKELLKLKIPINVDLEDPYDYSSMFKCIIQRGFVPEPYLSSSKFSIRSGQNNWEMFCEYGKRFFTLQKEGGLPGLIHLVFNSRTFSEAIVDEITKATKFLISDVGFDKRSLNLIVNDPQLISYCLKKGFNVTVSSASINAYKHMINLLIKKTDPESRRLSYVLPSTYQHAIPALPVNSFELLVNNGCFLQCKNGGVATDHTTSCPGINFRNSSSSLTKFCEKFYDDPFQETTDVINYWKFMYLREKGWKSFKISGRQASPFDIFNVVKYYLRTDPVPYIDSPVFYGRSSNG